MKFNVLKILSVPKKFNLAEYKYFVKVVGYGLWNIKFALNLDDCRGRMIFMSIF